MKTNAICWSPVLIATLLVMLCGCGVKKPTPYDKSYNAARTLRGIPIIPLNFTLYSELPNEIAWSDRNGFGPPPKGHLSKQVIISASHAVTKEVDCFYSGRGFTSLDPDAGSPDYEKLIVTYDYEAAKLGGTPWTAQVMENGGGFRKLPILEADQLLATWGISRLP